VASPQPNYSHRLAALPNAGDIRLASLAGPPRRAIYNDGGVWYGQEASAKSNGFTVEGTWAVPGLAGTLQTCR